MKRVLERFRALPFSFGMLLAVLVVVAIDFASLGTIGEPARDEAAKAAVSEWMSKNDNIIVKSLQSMLFGSGIWVTTLPADRLVPVESPGGSGKTKKVAFDIKDNLVKGRLELTVDFRSSQAAGVTAYVSEAWLGQVAPVNLAPLGAKEMIYSSNDMIKGRVRYYINAFSSFLWQLAVAGLAVGFIRPIGLGPRITILSSIVIAIITVSYASGYDPSWMAGSYALGTLTLSWVASELFRFKRHWDVIKLLD